MSKKQPLDPKKAVADADGEWLWYDPAQLTIEGRGWSDTLTPFERLPARVEGVVREPIWNLGRHSAGLSLRFFSDATAFAAKWEAAGRMNHMAATGVAGLDLYVRHAGRWRWLAVGRPTAEQNRDVLVKGLPRGRREYRLYLPLYSRIADFMWGIPPSAQLVPAPLPKQRPIVFYGSSITQGGCACRPGMSYPAILGRRLDWPTINLGFSGSAILEPEVVDLLSELDASVYVIDALPNINAEDVRWRVLSAMRRLREVRPHTPIVLVECATYNYDFLVTGSRRNNRRRNAGLNAAVRALRAEGVRGLTLVRSANLFGADGESTVDGVHPTDVGFLRIAKALRPTLVKLLRR